MTFQNVKVLSAVDTPFSPPFKYFCMWAYMEIPHEASAILKLTSNTDCLVIVDSSVSMVALSSRVPSARVEAVAVCQNCLTRESWIVGLCVKAYLICEPFKKSTISANPVLSLGTDIKEMDKYKDKTGQNRAWE
ncbi:hypothetical protein Tco_0281647 [Tanacetum coccineum]